MRFRSPVAGDECRLRSAASASLSFAFGIMNTESKLLRLYLRMTGAFAAHTFGIACRWSREHRRFLAAGMVCQGCGRVLLKDSLIADVRCYDAQNELVPTLQIGRKGKFFECPKC
jgi:hypothetical protein